jgi:Methyltransferase domain
VGALDASPPPWRRSGSTSPGLAHVVETIPSRSFETPWRRPISLLLVDALHNYASMSRDLRHFAPWLGAGALVAFHDYAWHFPGVRAFVDELLGGGGYTWPNARARAWGLCRRGAYPCT